MMDYPRHDFNLNMIEYEDENVAGPTFLYNSSQPEKKYPVVALLDVFGEEVSAVAEAVGGVVKLGEDSFTTFTFPDKVSFPG